MGIFFLFFHTPLFYQRCSASKVNLRNSKIYINGKEVASGNSGTPVAGGNLYIGETSSGNRAFNGTIDDVRIYNYALTAEQIKQIYNAGAWRLSQ